MIESKKGTLGLIGQKDNDGHSIIEVNFIERNDIDLTEYGFRWDNATPRDAQMEIHLCGTYESTNVDVELNADMSLEEIKDMVEEELTDLSALLISWGCTQEIVVDLGPTTFAMELEE